MLKPAEWVRGEAEEVSGESEHQIFPLLRGGSEKDSRRFGRWYCITE